MPERNYYAHSGRQPDLSDWQSLADHLRCVAKSAVAMMRSANAAEPFCRSVSLTGLLHDLGKYRPEFQQMIRGGSPPQGHACLPPAWLSSGDHIVAVKITELGPSDQVDVFLTNPPFGGEEEERPRS